MNRADRMAKPPGRTRKTPVKWDALQYQPAPSTPLLACKCGASWLDDKPGRDAHRVVFGHDPQTAS